MTIVVVAPRQSLKMPADHEQGAGPHPGASVLVVGAATRKALVADGRAIAVRGSKLSAAVYKAAGEAYTEAAKKLFFSENNMDEYNRNLVTDAVVAQAYGAVVMPEAFGGDSSEPEEEDDEGQDGDASQGDEAGDTDNDSDGDEPEEEDDEE